MTMNASVRRILSTALAVLALGAPLRTAAQQTPQPGQRVRISLADDDRVTGTLVRLPSDSLVLETADATRAYPRSAITQLELSRGSRSHWKTGAVGVTLRSARNPGRLIRGLMGL